MKKLTTFLLALLAGTMLLQAGPVSPEKALDVAGKLLSAGSPDTKAASLPLQVLFQDDAFYIIAQEGGGFVIVAADDAVQPVLGFSETNRFSLEGMPDNVRWWLDYIRKGCRAAVASTQVPEANRRAIRAQWDTFAETKAKLSESMLTDRHEEFFTVEWNQTDPANLLCPKVTGESTRAVCGCLPLALSMVMVHHGHPYRGTGTLPSYTYKVNYSRSYTVEGYDLGTVYDWEGMRELKTYSQFRGAKDPVKTNLAQLVKDMGVMVKAEYSNQGTGATSNNVPKLMAKHMGYYDDAYIAYKRRYNKDSWTQLMYEEIQKWPFMFCGYDTGSWGADAGHAYVIDGYALYNGTDRVFHFNFGWGGDCNGYYYATGQNVGDYNFDDDLEALLNLHPIRGQEYPEATLGFKLATDETTGLEEGGISLSSGDSMAASGATVTLYNIVGLSAQPFEGKAWLQVEGRDGSVKQRVLVKDFAGSPLAIDESIPSLTAVLTLDQPVKYGDQLTAVFTRESDDDPIPFACPENGSVVGSWPLMPSAFIATEKSYNAGDSFYFRLKNCNYRYNDASWTIVTPSGSTYYYVQKADSVKLTESGQYKVMVSTAKEKLTVYINVK